MEEKKTEKKEIRFATVISDIPLNMRKQGSLSAEKLMTLQPGTTIEVLYYSKKKDWTRVRYKGTVGYVMTKYIQTK